MTLYPILGCVQDRACGLTDISKGNMIYLNMKKSESKQVFTQRFTRSSSDKVLAGVAGGIAAFFEIDANLIRLIFVLFTVFGGSGVLIYIILWILMPEDTLKPGQEVKQNDDNSKQLFAGTVIAIGIFLLLNNFGLLWWFSLQKLWPLILIMLGISLLVKNEKRKTK